MRKLWQLTPMSADEFMSPLGALVDLRGNSEFALELRDAVH